MLTRQALTSKAEAAFLKASSAVSLRWTSTWVGATVLSCLQNNIKRRLSRAVALQTCAADSEQQYFGQVLLLRTIQCSCRSAVSCWTMSKGLHTSTVARVCIRHTVTQSSG